jgi:hypothetical protein
VLCKISDVLEAQEDNRSLDIGLDLIDRVDCCNNISQIGLNIYSH